MDLPLAQQACDQRRPAGLVGGAAAAAGVGMEVLMEEEEVFPGGMGGVAGICAVAGAVAGCVRLKEAAEAAGDLMRRVLQGHAVAAAGGQFDGEVFAVEMMVALQRFDNEIRDGEPNGAAPVGVAAKHMAVAFSGHVGDGVLSAVEMKGVWVSFMVFGKRTDAKG